ncbi:MAG TPA: EF-hand domain-containing protein [Usitatibacter sp.]|nr:EF-hand domain-containing protein [Usitatibacter sp.]
MKHFALLAALGLAAAGATYAAGPQGGGQDFMARLKKADTNGDGMISRDEAAKSLPRISQHFDEIDTNHDGQITNEELQAFHQKAGSKREERAAERFKRLDTDGDGRLSRAEAQAGAPRLAEHFDEIDANKDGFITPDELKAAREKHRAQK